MTQTPEIVGYTVLTSKDKLVMVQLFTDLQTGNLIHAQVATRLMPWGSWGPPTEVEKVVP